MNSFYYNIGSRIRELRELHRYTREKFAEIVDISPKFLYESETGQKGFSADTLYRIAKGFSVSCEYILTGDRGMSGNGVSLENLRLFDESQMKRIDQILKLIYEMGIV